MADDDDAAAAGVMDSNSVVDENGQAEIGIEHTEGAPGENTVDVAGARTANALDGSADVEESAQLTSVEAAGTGSAEESMDSHPGKPPAEAASSREGKNDMPDVVDNASQDGVPADSVSLPGEVMEDGVVEKKEAQAKAVPRRQGSVRMPLPPPVDIDVVGKQPADQGHKEQYSENLQEASVSRDGSSISPTSDTGRRRRSPQNSQQALAKQIEDMCARSVHASARYGNLAKLQDHVSLPSCVSEKDSAGFTPLHFAACYGHTPAVEILLERNAQVDCANPHGWTPLHVAARNGHEPGVKTLLSARASVHLEDKHKMTALHNASCSESEACVSDLLQQGAAVNQQDLDGWTPLHFAARFNNVDIVVLLLKQNADPNIQDRDGWTAMHNSARNGRNRCVQELLLHDSMDLTKKTRYGETPLHIACRKGKAKVVEKIVSWADKGEKLKLLLSQVDNDGKTPEEVASTPHIVSILRQEHFLGSGLYDINREDSEVDQDAARTKSRSCCVM